MTIRLSPENPDNYRKKEPAFHYRRIDLTPVKPKFRIAFSMERGKDFLLKRTVLRWSGYTDDGTTEPETLRIVPDPLPDNVPGESGYTPLQHVKYLDLEEGTNGHAGTESDPYSMIDHQAYLVANVAGDQYDTTVYVKGTATFIGGAFMFQYQNPRIDTIAWNPSVNGPWRLTVDQSPTHDITCLIAGGIIQVLNTGVLADWTDPVTTIMQNMVLIADNITFQPGDGTLIAPYRWGGNWLYAQNDITQQGGISYDSMFKCDDLAGGGDSYNSAYDYNASTVTTNFYGCNLLSTLPVPAITSPQSFFHWTTYLYELAYGQLVSGSIAGYRTGLYGYPRLTIGALEFTGNQGFYIDLEDVTYDNAGTEADPFSYEDWQYIISHYAYFPQSVFFVKGKYDEQTGYPVWFNSTNTEHEYRYWYRGVLGVDTEPWIIRSAAGFAHEGVCTIQGGILIAYKTSTDVYTDFFDGSRSGNNARWIDCVMYAKNLVFSSTGINSEWFQYNTVICSETYEPSERSDGHAWYDCLIKGTYVEQGSYQKFYNCGISGDLSAATAATAFLDCFTGWDSTLVPDVLAAYTGVMADFDILVLKTNIPENIFRGYEYPGYHTYPTGLYGFPRYGIGAAWFSYPVNTLTFGEITVDLRKSTSYFDYYQELYPHLFCSPVDSKDSLAVAAASPVDNDIFSVCFKKSLRRCQKTYNWLVEDSAVIVVDINKTPCTAIYPKYLDIVLEGYFYDSKELKPE